MPMSYGFSIVVIGVNPWWQAAARVGKAVEEGRKDKREAG